MSFVEWCNTNTGFVSAMLSLVGITISVIAIVVSIQTARLPYKKKIKLGNSLKFAITGDVGINAKMTTIGTVASATNVGNRNIHITYLGYAVKLNGTINQIIPTLEIQKYEKTLAPSEVFETILNRDYILTSLGKLNQNAPLYVLASDSENSKYMKKIGTVGRLVEIMKSA